MGREWSMTYRCAVPIDAVRCLGSWDNGLAFHVRDGKRVFLAVFIKRRLYEVSGPVRQ